VNPQASAARKAESEGSGIGTVNPQASARRAAAEAMPCVQ